MGEVKVEGGGLDSRVDVDGSRGDERGRLGTSRGSRFVEEIERPWS